MTPGHNADATVRLLSGHYRCPDDLAEFSITGDLPQAPGYFQFGSGTVCFGQCSFGVSSTLPARNLSDAYVHIRAQADTVLLPFDPVQVVNNLRLERYSGIPATRNGPAWLTTLYETCTTRRAHSCPSRYGNTCNPGTCAVGKIFRFPSGRWI